MSKTKSNTGKELKKEIILLMNLFKIAGHSTYRLLITHDEKEWVTHTHSPNFPVVTERKVFIVEKITGTITERK